MQLNKIIGEFSFHRFVVSSILKWYFLPLSLLLVLFILKCGIYAWWHASGNTYTHTQAHVAKAQPTNGTQQSNNTTMKFHWMKFYHGHTETKCKHTYNLRHTDTCIPCHAMQYNTQHTPTRLDWTRLDSVYGEKNTHAHTSTHSRTYHWNVWFVIEMARKRRSESEKQRMDTHHILRTRNKTPFGFCWFFSHVGMRECVCMCVVCVAVVLFGSYTQHQPQAHSFVLV